MDAGAPDVAATSAPVRSLSVFGPAGALDLVVPESAPTHQVARAYAEQAGMASIPLLFTTLGAAVRPDASVAAAGIQPGGLLIAAAGVARTGPRSARSDDAVVPGLGAARMAWVAAASGLGLVAGWLLVHAEVGGWQRVAVLAALAVAALAGVLPLGPHAATRAAVAPAFVFVAVLAAIWSPSVQARPLLIGVAGLSAGAAAAVARALRDPAPEALTVWIWAGGAFFAVAAAGSLLGLGVGVVWSVSLLAAALATRVVPALAVDVPDQLLIDLERLAVTAWSARDRPRNRRARTLVAPHRVAAVAASAGRLVTAAAAAIAVVMLLSAYELLAVVHTDLDRQGARWLVLLTGAAVLLAARNHRHRVAQTLLRVGGLGVWGLLAVASLRGLGPSAAATVAAATTVGAAALIVAAVATGRGWRSAWWGRRAEVAETLVGTLAVAAVVVSSGLFRNLWEIGSTMFRG